MTRLNEERRREEPAPFGVFLVAERSEPVVSTGGLRVLSDVTLESCPALQVLVGSGGTRVKSATSVC